MEEPKPGRTSIAEFEKLLATSDQKLELLEGEVVAFAGGSIVHGMLCSRLHSAVSLATKPPCHAFTSDVAVLLADRATYVFPDVSRTCESLDANAMHITAPDLVVEVISPESKAPDRARSSTPTKTSRASWSISSSIHGEYGSVSSGEWLAAFGPERTTYGIGETVELRTAGVTTYPSCMPVRAEY